MLKVILLTSVPQGTDIKTQIYDVGFQRKPTSYLLYDGGF